MSNWCKLKGIYCSMTTINGYCQVTTCMHKDEPTSICNDAKITAGYGSVSWSDYKTGTSCDSVVLPTVNAEPVRHGHWVRNDNGTYSCSECQSWIPNEQHYYARYCLHCGAKMEKETNE